MYGKRTVGFFSLASHARRVCEARALRARKTLTLRSTDFFTDFEKKNRLFCSLITCRLQFFKNNPWLNSFLLKYNILVCQYGSINIAWLSRIDSVLVSCLRDTGSGLLEGRSPVYLKPWIYEMGSNKDVQLMQKNFDMTYQESDCMTIPQQ